MALAARGTLSSMAAARPRSVRLEAAAIETFLLQQPLFKGANRQLASRIARVMDPVEYPAGATIIGAGMQAEVIAFLMRGEAALAQVNAATGATQTIEKLSPGDLLGEIGPLLDLANPFAVVAQSQCVVLRANSDVLSTLCSRVPDFAHTVARRLARRLVNITVAQVRARPTAATPVVTAPVPPPAEGVIPHVEVNDYELTEALLTSIPSKVMASHRLLPLRLDQGRLTVGMVSPRSHAAQAALRSVLANVKFEIVAISADAFAEAVVRHNLDPAATGTGVGRRISPETIVFQAEEAEADKNVRVVGDEVVRVVSRIVATGLESGASDIHIEPDVKSVRVRFRINGGLQDWKEIVPTAFLKGMVARIKILANLDPTGRRSPQDGRIGLNIGSREVDLRVSTLPATRGEKIVMRVLEAAGMTRALEKIFLDRSSLAIVRAGLNRPFGAVVIAGPTGSGKSSTLYSMIHERKTARPDTNVIMVEDPVEYRLPGITQVQVSPDHGLSFAQVLRAMLRQDPDVIALGEMRDPETSQLALEAAMTGHLVMSSVHGNTATAVIQRLEQLGNSRALLAQGLSLIIVQRLVRRLCSCATLGPCSGALLEGLAHRKIVERAANLQLPRAAGCPACADTGYAGRIPVVELLHIDDTLREALMAGRSIGEIEQLAVSNNLITSFAKSAAYLLAARKISPSEALLAVAS